MSVKVEKIVAPVMLGEGPHWDERQQSLFFVSIHDCTIHKYVLASKTHTKTKLDGRVGFIIPVEGTTNQFVVGVETTFKVIEWDGAEGSAVKVVRELATVDEEVTPKTRINDGKADPRGRLFAGTMGHEATPGNILNHTASFYRIDARGCVKVCEKIGISNGLAWADRAMYYTDSLEKNIRKYDYDVETGEISNLSYIFDFEKNNITGFPDGTTIDTDGNLWVAVFGASCVLKINPNTGELLQKVSIPASQVTSVTFGGPNYDILFVTTACMEIGGPQKPPSGATFMVTGLGVKGLKNVNFKL
ncbi:regucalcin-like [Aricia agestis]|uniref:regucalcin-like n=1 Tax=Aricia agestis TaxID=91739 RepID=UPI001C2019C9|nr:regucalcin-like [Aricia agestis]XP_041980350.1 regucalcin-like [Aricia agestis]